MEISIGIRISVRARAPPVESGFRLNRKQSARNRKQKLVYTRISRSRGNNAIPSIFSSRFQIRARSYAKSSASVDENPGARQAWNFQFSWNERTVDSLDLPSVSFQDIPFNKIPAKLRHRRYKQPAILTALDSKVKLLLTNDHYCFPIGGAPIFFWQIWYDNF